MIYTGASDKEIHESSMADFIRPGGGVGGAVDRGA
jgi:hypothetical protein